MTVTKFVNDVLGASEKFHWIKRRDVDASLAYARIRLWLNDSFVDVFYREKTNNISYAYIENDERVFGVNNMKIGWHIHPFGEAEKHEKIDVMTIDEFLELLEKELEKREKIG